MSDTFVKKMAKTWPTTVKCFKESSVTSDDYVTIIDTMEEILGKDYLMDLYRISEGGVEMIKWPGMNPGEKKSIKLIHLQTTMDLQLFPWISKNIRETFNEWKSLTFPIPIFSGINKVEFYIQFKSFLNNDIHANLWTTREIEVFRFAISKLNFKTKEELTINVSKYCSHCFSQEPIMDTKQELSRCSQCKNSYYCNADCQRNHWQKHRLTCKRITH